MPQGDSINKQNHSKEGVTDMKKKQPFHCQEDMDFVHHQLVEQIARISVDEEEERMRAELELTEKDEVDH